MKPVQLLLWLCLFAAVVQPKRYKNNEDLEELLSEILEAVHAKRNKARGGMSLAVSSFLGHIVLLFLLLPVLLLVLLPLVLLVLLLLVLFVLLLFLFLLTAAA